VSAAARRGHRALVPRHFMDENIISAAAAVQVSILYIVLWLYSDYRIIIYKTRPHRRELSDARCAAESSRYNQNMNIA